MHLSPLVALWSALAASFIAVIVGIALLRRYARAFLRARGRRSDRTPASLSLDAEPFEIARDRSESGASAARVRGWVLRPAPVVGAAAAEREARPLLLFAHGWQSNAGDMLPWAAPLVGAGFHAVVYDALGHGESDASEFTSIRHLRDDLRLVTRWALRHPLARDGVILFGHSMGGAVAVLAAADGAPVRGVIAAGAPTDALEVAREYLHSKGMPARLLLRLLVPFWRPIVAESADSLRPITRIDEVTVPVLLLHGTQDRQVSVRHAREMALAHPQARLALFGGADHYTVPAQHGYVTVVRSFVADAMSRAAAYGAAG